MKSHPRINNFTKKYHQNDRKVAQNIKKYHRNHEKSLPETDVGPTRDLPGTTRGLPGDYPGTTRRSPRTKKQLQHDEKVPPESWKSSSGIMKSHPSSGTNIF